MWSKLVTVIRRISFILRVKLIGTLLLCLFFCSIVVEVPSNWYSPKLCCRFRREAREERKSSLRTYTEQLSESASSSVPVVIIMTLGIIATTIACLPILLGLKFVSVFVTDSKDIIDSSVVPSSVDSKNDTSLTERLVSSLLGESCQDDKRYSRVWELKWTLGCHLSHLK